ncbi:MAG: hypothetical protein Q7T55_09220 [Solirubrobacteraceae bacterium]|nr:hypothetical protein [Solirubrobacteraceae bacterium]
MVSQRAAVDRFIRKAVDPVLSHTGFERVGGRAWERRTEQLRHVIAAEVRNGVLRFQWGVVSAEATPFVWRTETKSGNVGDAVLASTVRSFSTPPGRSKVDLDLVATDKQLEIASGTVRADLQAAELPMRAFTTRRALRSYLLENRELNDPRDFVIPSGLPLKLYVAAVLAALDKDRSAVGLLEETEVAMLPLQDGEPTQTRMKLLRDAVKSI